MKGISVICPVYNEEKRIEGFLLNFMWSDDLVIIDLSSQDKTRDIILKYKKKPLVIPYTKKYTDFYPVVDQAKHEWILFVTASDIIHPELVKAMLELINRPDFNYDVICYPYANFVFGINNKRSPWFLPNKRFLIRKSTVRLSDCVHEEIGSSSNRVYFMPYHEEHNVSHLTHETLDTFFDRHIRYSHLETEKYNEKPKKAFKKSLCHLSRSIKHVTIGKKVFLLGWDGIALGLAYISYFIMVFLSVWQKYRGKGPSVYRMMRDKSIKDWEDHNKKAGSRE